MTTRAEVKINTEDHKQPFVLIAKETAPRWLVGYLEDVKARVSVKQSIVVM